jgi:hypothetical protein
LLLEVWDCCTDAPKPACPGLWEEHGRGLRIVDSVSVLMGYETFCFGKVVWVLLGVTRGEVWEKTLRRESLLSHAQIAGEGKETSPFAGQYRRSEYPRQLRTSCGRRIAVLPGRPSVDPVHTLAPCREGSLREGLPSRKRSGTVRGFLAGNPEPLVFAPEGSGTGPLPKEHRQVSCRATSPERL